jgi:RNA polymerase sigma factor (sigma-70 family)
VSISPVEQALVQSVRDGSPEALATLYARYADRLMAVAYRLTGRAEDAEDVLHDVFLGLPEAFRRYEERGLLGPWLRQLTVRVALARMRRATRAREVSLVGHTETTPGRGEALEDRITLATALGTLPDGLRSVFVLKVIEGHSHAEIAKMLGITPGASEVRLVRAMKQLRSMLGDQRQ